MTHLPAVDPSGPTALGVFVKFWTPGRAKTRLATRCGPERAAEFAAALFRLTWCRTAGLADRRTLGFAPAEAAAEFRAEVDPDTILRPQGDGDLGARMAAHFRAEEAAGAGRMVLIGADAPTFPRAAVTEAFAMLDRVPAVLGPATDGGYWLIGFRRGGIVRAVFEGMAWSTATVCEETIARLRAAGVPFGLTTTWSDVDEPDDLPRLAGELASLAADPHEPRPARTAAARLAELCARSP